MSKRILITGGAGFIGSHLADELLRSGYEVRALDNLSPQVHGPDASRPDYLNPEVELHHPHHPHKHPHKTPHQTHPHPHPPRTLKKEQE
jgi:nucleoside-diphosphate-sugar epimerase